MLKRHGQQTVVIALHFKSVCREYNEQLADKNIWQSFFNIFQIPKICHYDPQ